LFDPSGLYVKAGLESQTNQYEDAQAARPCYGTGWCLTPAYSGPIGTLKLGVSVAFTEHLTVDYGFTHRSYVNTGRDRGLEFAFLELTYRPFR
jgi:hypothetical protein